MELLDPTVEQPAQAIDFAPRPKALAGKRVALIENTKHNSSVPAHKEVIDEVKAGYDVVVAGVGD